MKEKEEKLPEWAENEIRSVQFKQMEKIKRTGYILSIYDDDRKIDIQLYEALPDGRIIVEGIDIPNSIKINELQKAVVYEFEINMDIGLFSKELVELLKSKYNLDMDKIYKFELNGLQLMDVESDLANQSLDNDEEE
ncbi:MAG: hypothetical protein DA328_09280 [Nitrososphaeraceae archaeon]|nr:hypothetical protein [Nitrososphaeraceae archaeon]